MAVEHVACVGQLHAEVVVADHRERQIGAARSDLRRRGARGGHIHLEERALAIGGHRPAVDIPLAVAGDVAELEEVGGIAHRVATAIHQGEGVDPGDGAGGGIEHRPPQRGALGFDVPVGAGVEGGVIELQCRIHIACGGLGVDAPGGGRAGVVGDCAQAGGIAEIEIAEGVAAVDEIEGVGGGVQGDGVAVVGIADRNAGVVHQSHRPGDRVVAVDPDRGIGIVRIAPEVVGARGGAGASSLDLGHGVI